MTITQFLNRAAATQIKLFLSNSEVRKLVKLSTSSPSLDSSGELPGKGKKGGILGHLFIVCLGDNVILMLVDLIYL